MNLIQCIKVYKGNPNDGFTAVAVFTVVYIIDLAICMHTCRAGFSQIASQFVHILILDIFLSAFVFVSQVKTQVFIIVVIS